MPWEDLRTVPPRIYRRNNVFFSPHHIIIHLAWTPARIPRILILSLIKLPLQRILPGWRACIPCEFSWIDNGLNFGVLTQYSFTQYALAVPNLVFMMLSEILAVHPWRQAYPLRARVKFTLKAPCGIQACLFFSLTAISWCHKIFSSNFFQQKALRARPIVISDFFFYYLKFHLSFTFVVFPFSAYQILLSLIWRLCTSASQIWLTLTWPFFISAVLL